MPRLAFVLLAVGLAALSADPTAAQEKKQKKKSNDPAPAAAGKAEDDARVLPVFDPGSHTQPISAMGFTPDGAKLVTVGQDFTVQVWSAATGDRLDLLRLPGYGREKGFDPGRWDVAAVSPDGNLVAVGGQPKSLHDHAAKAYAPARLVLVDVARRRVARADVRGNNVEVSGLAFSPDGDTLAVALDGGRGAASRLLVVGGVRDRLAKADPVFRTADCTVKETPHRTAITSLAFSPDGRRLLLAENTGKRLSVWDVPAGAAPVPALAHPIDTGNYTLGVGWSPDGTHFVHSLKDSTDVGRVRGFDVRTAAGELVKAYRIPDLSPALRPKAYAAIFGVRYLNPTTIYFVANAAAGTATDGGGTVAGVLDLPTGKSRRLGAHPEGQNNGPTAAAAADGTRVAYTVVGNTEALVVPAGGGPAVRCGQRTPIPYYVGWSNDPARPGFAWTDDRQTRQTQERDAGHLRHGFDLAAMEPIGTVAGGKYDTARWKLGEWAIQTGAAKKGADDGLKGAARLVKGDVPVVGLPLHPSASRTLIPTAGGPPRLAYSTHLQYHCDRAAVYNPDGTLLTRLLPDTPNFHDLAASADGRFLVAATGTPRLVVYRTDGSPYPLLSFAMLNGEWVCWTPEGYYAASPGGEKLFGFAVNNGPNALVTFHPAEKFAKQYRRPDVIRLAVEKGSVAEALKALAAAPAPPVETILPPAAKVELVEQRGATVKVKATADSGAKDKPIVAMRVLLDGRPLGDGKGVWTPVPGPTAAAEFELTVPPGASEVKVLARSADGAAVSDPLVVRRPKAAGTQPTVYRVCVGVNEYDDPGLKLAAAAKDAGDFFKAVEANCVGPDNRFGAAAGELLTDKAATRPAVLAALAAVRKKARPGDLLVVFFAGHGVKAEGGFYLLTKEAKPAGALKGTAVSGDDLRDALATVECPVLLVLDACHSASAARTLRPATDDLTRSLTDDSVGVTVLAAAMSHEVAGATAENGHFTAGLLKGLAAGQGVPFDPYERQLYVHHLYSVAFAEVRRATGGKQNPFLNMPWTVPPVPVREVPAR